MKEKKKGKSGKYQRDVRCSVGLNKRTQATTHVGARPALPRIVRARFERRNARPRPGVTSSTIKRSVERPERDDSKLTAAQKWAEDILNTGLRPLRKSFMESVKPYTPKGTRSAFNDDANAEKNRYDDVELLDCSRVKLTTIEDDYVHASYVTVHERMKIICAQGPMDNTVQSFWIMIVEQRAKVILQLCQNVEDGKEKCVEYVPLKENGFMEFGPVKVKVVAPNMNTGAMEKVTRTIVEVSYNGNAFETTHVLYASWPDHTVPESLSTYMEMRNLVLRLYNGQPVVAHCSAGIGRTGSYAAIEIAVHRLVEEKDRNFNLIEAVQRLRDQRMQSIQNDLQYAFVIRMVLEILLSKNLIAKSPILNKFCKEYNDLIARRNAEVEKLKKKD